MEKPRSPTRPVPADPLLRVPKRRSSQNALMVHPSSDRDLTTPSSTLQQRTTIRSRGRSTSPIRSRRQARRAPSRTFIPPVAPTDILDFPDVRHPRVNVAVKPSAPVCVGGATIEGDVVLTIDGGKENSKAWPPVSLGRIVVSLIGVEHCNGKQWIFQSLATDLIDETHLAPAEILAEASSTFGITQAVRPSTSLLPFRLDLPVNVGPPPYKSKKLGIRYVLSVTVEAKTSGKVHFARTSQNITILTIHDPEKALVNLSTPLLASDELTVGRWAGNGPGVAPSSIKLTAGLHRQTWISGYTLFVDILVDNGSHRRIDKIDIILEKATLMYKSASSAGPADSLRLPDRVTKEIVTRKSMKEPQDTVGPHMETIRTCRLDVPVGLVSVDSGRFFGVRFFISVRVHCSFSKRVMVELPITIIHPNSIDVPPNSLAQVAAAVEHKHRDHLFGTRSPYRYTAGRAFVAARERPFNEMVAGTLLSQDIRDVAMHLNGSPGKVKRRSSHLGISSQGSIVREKRNSRPLSRPQTSLDIYGPDLQRTTSGLAFDDSDKENQPSNSSPRARLKNRKGRPFSRVDGSVLHELELARKRSSVLSGYKNVAAEATRA